MRWKVCSVSNNYDVSNTGLVRRVTPSKGACVGKILRAGVGKVGYSVVVLDGVCYYVHRIVCETFHGPSPEGKPLVLHRNDVKLDNRASNLYWGDRKQNVVDSKTNGRYVAPVPRCGEKHHSCKLTDLQIAEIRSLLASGETQTVLAKRFSVGQPHISSIKRNVLRKSGMVPECLYPA